MISIYLLFYARLAPFSFVNGGQLRCPPPGRQAYARLASPSPATSPPLPPLNPLFGRPFPTPRTLQGTLKKGGDLLLGKAPGGLGLRRFRPFALAFTTFSKFFGLRRAIIIISQLFIISLSCIKAVFSSFSLLPRQKQSSKTKLNYKLRGVSLAVNPTPHIASCLHALCKALSRSLLDFFDNMFYKNKYRKIASVHKPQPHKLAYRSL